MRDLVVARSSCRRVLERWRAAIFVADLAIGLEDDDDDDDDDDEEDDSHMQAVAAEDRVC